MTAIVRAREGDRRDHAARVAADEGDVGRLDGHVGAGADRDPEVGRGEGRGVVDPVADHGHDLAPGAAARRRPPALSPGRTSATDALGRDARPGAATARAVARWSPVTSQASMPAAVERPDGLGRLGLDRVGDRDEARRRRRRRRRRRASSRPRPGPRPPRPARRGRRPARPGSGRCRRGRSARRRSPRRRRPRSPRRRRRRGRRAAGRARRATIAAASGCSEPASTAAASRSRSSSARSPGRDDLGHRGLAPRQRPGLVEDDRRHPVGVLERLAAADEDPGLGAPPGPDHDRGRRGEAHRAGAGDDDHGDEGGERQRHLRLRAEQIPEDEGGVATPRTTGTKMPLIRSASRWIGAFEPWARLDHLARSGRGPCRARRGWPASRSCRSC